MLFCPVFAIKRRIESSLVATEPNFLLRGVLKSSLHLKIILSSSGCKTKARNSSEGAFGALMRFAYQPVTSKPMKTFNFLKNLWLAN